jgi:hypothetical protein
MMLFRILLFIQFELKKQGARRALELPLLEVDPIAVGRQPDAEYIMLIKDKIAFLFHPQQVVHPLPPGILPIALRQHIGAIRILREELRHQD